MADVRYVVEFKAVDELSNSTESNPSNSNEKTRILSKEPTPTRETVSKENNINQKAFAKFLTVYAGYQIVNDIHNKIRTTQAIGRGDNLQAVMQSERNSLTNKFVNMGLTLVGGAVIGGLPGLALAGASQIYSIAREAINIGIQNQLRIEQIQAQRHVANNEQERFIRNQTTEEIRQW